MINIDELESTILELEQHDTTYATCEKLAWLYIVRDHISNTPRAASETVPEIGKSEFMTACAGCDIMQVLVIIDEHMEAIKALYPREYNALIAKIKQL